MSDLKKKLPRYMHAPATGACTRPLHRQHAATAGAMLRPGGVAAEALCLSRPKQQKRLCLWAPKQTHQCRRPPHTGERRICMIAWKSSLVRRVVYDTWSSMLMYSTGSPLAGDRYEFSAAGGRGTQGGFMDQGRDQRRGQGLRARQTGADRYADTAVLLCGWLCSAACADLRTARRTRAVQLWCALCDTV